MLSTKVRGLGNLAVMLLRIYGCRCRRFTDLPRCRGSFEFAVGFIFGVSRYSVYMGHRRLLNFPINLVSNRQQTGRAKPALRRTQNTYGLYAVAAAATLWKVELATS
jgi:hypothetical protein